MLLGKWARSDGSQCWAFVICHQSTTVRVTLSRLAYAASGLLAALVAIQPAAAQRSGTYAVEGRAVDGGSYQGSATLTATGPQTWRMTWRVSGETSSSVALTVGNMLVIGYVSGRETGVAAYEVMPDGCLAGRRAERAVSAPKPSPRADGTAKGKPFARVPRRRRLAYPLRLSTIAP